MRVAIVSDIHGNLTAFEAVLADLRLSSPDLVFHGGDLADSGSSPVEIVDRIRAFGWSGVAGNTDEALFRPSSLVEYAEQSPGFRPLLPEIEERMAWTREKLGSERLQWLSQQALAQEFADLVLVHASPADLWRSPSSNASDSELEEVYGRRGKRLVVFGHIHQPFVRTLPTVVIGNSGSVGLPFDGDPRAAYLLIEEGKPQVRRVAYDTDLEIQRLLTSGLPRAEGLAQSLRSGKAQGG